MAEAIIRYVLTHHALYQLRRRRLPIDVVASVLTSPGQRERLLPGRDVLQSVTELDGRRYLIRVIVDTDSDPPMVVTAYRTSKIRKYWKAEP